MSGKSELRINVFTCVIFGFTLIAVSSAASNTFNDFRTVLVGISNRPDLRHIRPSSPYCDRLKVHG